ncbi:MAG: nucleoside triphosphate pyrophosphohydrolase [Pseudomonadota bacterium]|nr:nucleoside triphosphate pyrophosphohydrolase [Pseudomonadota bacterium]MEC9300082.1 nucleoside triphosphate pyrophosphohydrolase [Pseudomonadota bacterium]MED5386181.1 nucleoside triphosphate pyrophosphohydrolase [Pseudomonadota bacterium]
MNEAEFIKRSAIEKLVALMVMLRDQKLGCPWDLEQTIESLVPYTLEEVYEVVDAIDKNDMVELKDELGDLLFQVVFYAQIACEEGLFTFDDVADSITAKLIRRHPHVFPDATIGSFGSKSYISSDQVVVNWEAIKQEEKIKKLQHRAQRGQTEKEDSTDAIASTLDDVPRSLPALERAYKLQKRAANTGFDWSDIAPVIEKLKEESAEFQSALETKNQQQIQAEIGDVLFTAVNLARHASVEPEIALRAANHRFEERFKWIETTLYSRDQTVNETNQEQLDELWEQAKGMGL